ncbi:MAG: hypothetical protein JO223_04650 [Hyphomicrobiales bacterium]|nr:hypothetical protein [Hyphomicrobiales bacterium]MBV8438992.1 hypothetical protein [Hyphomicrobiales bacterium]
MNRLLLVFGDGNGDALDLQAFVEALDPGAQIYTLNDHVCFLRTALDAFDVSDKFLPFAGSRLHFVTDITSSPAAGRMFGSFWDFFKPAALPAAAE